MNKILLILLILVIGCCEGKVKKAKKGTITTQMNSQESGVKGQGSKNIIGTITGINWYSSLEEAKNNGSFTNLPLMIDFYADWCVWCKKLDNETFKDKDVIRESLNFIPVRLDCTRDRNIVKEYGILGLPTIVFLGTSGVRYDCLGFRNASDFLLEMKKAQEKMKPH
ncbi:MAG: thioredoxin fold domain-containing protein [bacterium]